MVHTAGQTGPDRRDPMEDYRGRASACRARRDDEARRFRAVAIARVIVFLAAAILIIWPLWTGSPATVPLVSLGAAGLVAFVALIRWHNRIEDRAQWYGALADVNDEAGHRVGRDWSALEVPPLAGPGRDHPCADDLDVFGRASLMQLLGAPGTVVGRRTLAEWLVAPVQPSVAVERQRSVAELAPLIDFRQDLSVLGRLAESGTHDLDVLLSWAEAPLWLSARPRLLWSVRGLAAATATLIALHAGGVLAGPWWLLPMLAGLLVSYLCREQLVGTLDRAFWRERVLRHYERLFRRMTDLPCDTSMLRRLQSELGAAGDTAAHQILRLRRIVELADLRHVPLFHFPIHAVTLWDFHVLWLLERWQTRAGRRMRAWFTAVGEMEALSALAEISHDNPGWAFPRFDAAGRTLKARDLGHPFLRDGVRVANDVEVGPPGTCLLVTGSNMSGKSTLLKAIGVNVILAHAGGPVCASDMQLPPVALFTCIRVQDSLEEGVSYFMAGLRRLKVIVDAARSADAGASSVLYLLDEVLQGTNTAERQVAVRVILRHLLSLPAIGVITTHDLSLADEADLARACTAVHFSEGVEGAGDALTLSFDYRLRPGLATSRNALRLLRMMGLGGEAPRIG
ncbi:MAG: hypothetical protein IMZ67_00105 [Acidobacteria bacterium]|nr:hypothetical protein [Acidobacteriota bacterium]